MTPSPPASRSRLVVVTALGITQILAWGSTYYLPAVLAVPIVRDTGWPLDWVVGSLSVGLLIAGLISPRVGVLIDRHGGRPVMAASAVLFAIGMLILGLAPSLPVFIAGWVVLGVAMGGGLYDPAFSTLGRLYGENARGAITHVTLYGGFASTVCWPFTALLAAQVGWRGTCLAYAAIHLTVVLPLFWFGLPREATRAAASHADGAVGRGLLRPEHRLPFALLAAGLTLASVVMTVVAVHILAMLQERGLALAAAVGFGALIGPSQVGARILEATLGRHLHPVWTMLLASVAVAVGLAMLMGDASMIAAGIILYGAGNGIRSIARGTVPLALFGKDGYAILMGWLSLPILVMQAISPTLGAILLAHFGPEGTIGWLAALSVVNVLAAAALLPYVARPRPA